jgi:hypothetical protein
MMQPGEHFSEMAVDIARNLEKFGGAFVIVPPAMGGDPVSRLVVASQGQANQAQTAVNFWNLLQSEIKTVLQRLEDQERQAFGGRR